MARQGRASGLAKPLEYTTVGRSGECVLASRSMSGWTLFFTALGLAMVLEGLPYLVSPTSVRRFTAFIEQARDSTLRAIGVLLMAGGLLVAYLATR